MRLRRFKISCAALALTAVAATSSLAATSPAQPKAGFGASLDASTDVVKRSVGKASNATYVFHLASAPAEPRSVVVLLHAWGAVNPVVYGGWIEHLARRGHLVLFPAFQTVGRTRPVEASEGAATLIKDALAALANDPQAKPDPAKLIYLGHSAGAGIAMNLASNPKAKGLAPPKLVFAMMPGGIASDEKSRGILLNDLPSVDAGTAIVAMVGDKEFQAAERVSRRILRETTNVPANRKMFMRSASDDHGFPPLTATLASPASPKETYDKANIKVEPDPPINPKGPRPRAPKWSADMVLSGEQQVLLGQLQRNVTDTLDYVAYWRTFDMLAAAAMAGTDMETVRKDPALVDMGRWTDGWPVRRLAAEIPKVADPATASASASAPVAVPGARAPAAAAPIQSKQPVTRRSGQRPRR